MGFSLKISFGLSVASLMLVTGCKLPEMKKEDTLVKTSVAAVRDALWTELGKVDLHQIKQGQYAFYESNYRAETSSVVKVVEVERLVGSVTSTDTATDIVMKEAFRTYDSAGAIVDEKLSDIIWNLDKTIGSFKVWAHQFNTLSADEYDYAEYYNLVTKRVTVDAPPYAQQRPNCGGFAHCKISGLEVSYLAHLISDGQVRKRIHYRVILSADVPAVFWDETNPIWPVVSECMAHTIQNIYVNECVVLRDAEK